MPDGLRLPRRTATSEPRPSITWPGSPSTGSGCSTRSASRRWTSWRTRSASTREDPSIVAVVVTGAGERAFSAGGDFHAMMRLNRINGHLWNDRMLRLAMTIRGLPVPVIAMVHGPCVGGGHELALWCDLVISAEDGVFGQTGAKVGACPTVGATQYLPRIVGERLAREMILLARTLTRRGSARSRTHQQGRPEGRAASRDRVAGATGSRASVRRRSGPPRSRSTSNPTSSTLRGSTAWSCSRTCGGPRNRWRGCRHSSTSGRPTSCASAMANKAEVDRYLDGLARDENESPRPVS